MKKFVPGVIIGGFLLFALPVLADNVKEEHTKAEKGDYKEDLEDSIKKYGGSRLKEEDAKHHEKEAKDNEHKEKYKVKKSGDTTEHQKN